MSTIPGSLRCEAQTNERHISCQSRNVVLKMLRLKRQQYSPSKMARAIQCVRDGMSKKAAAKLCCVPRTTRVPIEHTKPAKKTVLTAAEEDVLVNYINLMAEIGYPVSRFDLKQEVKRIINKDGRPNPFKNNMPGDDWYDGFCRRHPEIKERKPQPLGKERAIITLEMVESWFKTLTDHSAAEVPGWEEMIRDPRRVFNADESGFPLCTTTGRVLAPIGAKHVYQVVSNNKQQITVMACFNANGDYLPPLIIFPGQRMRDIGLQNFPEAIYGVSNKGWMDTELFVHFLKEFSNFVESNCIRLPVLLFVDGHSTHISLRAAEFCQENHIILYCLLSNATHLLQACDIGLFGPLKTAWRHELKFWYMEHMGEIVTKSIFPGLFKRSWEKVTTLANAANGFKRSGLFPLTPDNIDKTKHGPSKLLSPPKPPESNSATCNTQVKESVNEILGESSNNCGRTSVSYHSAPATISQILSDHTCTPSITEQPTDMLISTTVSIDTVVSDSNDDTNHSCRTNLNPSISRPTILSSPFARRIFAETVANNQFTVPPVMTPKLQTYVSPAFSAIRIPEIKHKPRKTLLNKIPKALTGVKALEMLREREETKRKEAKIKEERAIEKKKKQVERELFKIKKKEERDRKKAEKENLKAKKAEMKKRGKRKRAHLSTSESSSDEENAHVKITFEDSDIDLEEIEPINSCFSCEKICDCIDDWVQCVLCDRKLHVTCSNNLIFSHLPKKN